MSDYFCRMLRQLLWLCFLLAATSLRAQDPTQDSLQTADGYLAQGNAYFAEGATGEAILAFERGLRLRPNHATLRNNLRYVREEAGITAPPLPEFFLVRWWRTVGAAIGSTTAYVLALVCWWLAVAAGLYWYLRRRQMTEKRRFVLLPASILLLALAALCYLLGQSRYAFLHRTDEAILIAPTAALRVSPTEAASVEAELASGQRLLITDRVGDYVKVTLEDGRQGYLLVGELAVI